MIRELKTMPFDHIFIVDGNEELCHATGYEMLEDGIWWNEYIDHNGEFHYGN